MSDDERFSQRGKDRIGGRKRGRRCRGTWTPPETSAHFGTSIASLREGETFGWSSDPADHLVIYKPQCNLVAACDNGAMRWQRCGACKAVFAGCNDHLSASGHEVGEARARHECKAPPAPVISLASERTRRGLDGV